MFKLMLAVTILAVIGSVYGECETDDMCPMPYTPEMQKEMVDYHNKVRGTANPTASNMQKMYWDDTLAKMALDHASKCVFEHDTAEDRRFGGYRNVGQNLFGGTGKPNPIDPVRGWYGEKQYFTYGEHTNYTVGHYTQVMYHGSARIGCGGAYCPNIALKYLVTCNYLKGQYNYKTPYGLGATCAMCPDSCKDGVCDCGGKVCKNGATLDINTCQCKCQGHTSGPLCGKVNCDVTEVWYCKRYTDYCSLKYGYYVRNNCPVSCGLC